MELGIVVDVIKALFGIGCLDQELGNPKFAPSRIFSLELLR